MPSHALALGLLLAGAAPVVAPPGRPSLLVVTVDTLRADHLSCYGYSHLTSPVLDRLAREGARFERAYCAIPYTGPSHVSLFTGRYPQEHGAKVNGQAMAKEPGLVTLAEALQRSGYRTGAFVSAWPLTRRLTHLDRGFETYDQEMSRNYQVVHTYRSAEEVTPPAVAWLREAAGDDAPFFLWVHYFDPHSPYELHEGFTEIAAIPDRPERRPRAGTRMARRVRRYDSEVAYTDHHLGKLVDAVKEQGRLDSTVVIVTADHGESLGEHGFVGHGKHLWEDIARVPLIVRFPPLVAAGGVVPEPVSQVDVLPTLLELLEVELPLKLPGRSLAARLAAPGSDGVARPVRVVTFSGKKGWVPKWLSWMWYTDSRDRRPLRMASVGGDLKTIFQPRKGRVQVYDLAADPYELSPLCEGKRERCDGRFGPHVAALVDWFDTTASREGVAELEKEDLEALRSLGYVQ